MSACSCTTISRGPASSRAPGRAATAIRRRLDGAVAPIVVNNNNFAKGEPTLLSFDDAATLFHEFGHGLHGLLSRVRYRSQSGTAVRRDFVEFPSQIFEHWMSAPETLRRYARHYRTGEPMPEELLRRLLAARTFNQGFATVEYTASRAARSRPAPRPDRPRPSTSRGSSANSSTGSRCRRKSGCVTARRISSTCLPAAAMPPGITPISGPRCWTPTALPPSPRPAISSIRHWRRGSKDIYSAGDTDDPMELYRAFRGRDPTIAALLEQRGLTGAAVRRLKRGAAAAPRPANAGQKVTISTAWRRRDP